jgi:ABC-type polysaccharide/polyol phosphate transport system ATPase subunit
MSSSDLALSVRNLSKAYTIRHHATEHITLAELALERARHPLRRAERERFWALRNAGFDVDHGEVLSIIGRNGAGKSTLLKILSRITTPTEGEVHLWGRVGCLLEVGTGFHPELTGRENTYLNGALLGMKRREIDRQFDAIVDYAGVERFLDTPVKRYSSGMYVRLAFAIAAHLSTEILIVDEVLAVGDIEFQKKCVRTMEEAAHQGRTVLIVTHNMNIATQLARRSLLLEHGTVVADGKSDEVADRYRSGHPQFRELMRRHQVSDADRPRRDLSRDVELRWVGFSDEQPLPVPHGHDLEIVVCLESLRDLRSFRARVGLLTSNGTPVGAGFSKPVLDMSAGTTERFRLTVPKPQLSAGQYSLEISIGRGDHFGGVEIYDFVQGVLPFEVQNPVRYDGAVGSGWKRTWGPVQFGDLGVEREPAVDAEMNLLEIGSDGEPR